MMQDYEPKNAMELADRIWNIVLCERRTDHPRGEGLELQLNTWGWGMLRGLPEMEFAPFGEEGSVSRFRGIPIKLIPGTKDTWRLVWIIARG